VNTSVYAKPVMPRIIVRPTLATLAIHALLLYLLTANWSFDDKEVVRVKPVPKVINARLVDASEFKPRPKPKPRPAPRVKKPQPRVEAKPRPQPKPKPKVVEAAKKPQPEPEPKPQPKAVEKPQPKPEPRITPDELAKLMAQELESPPDAAAGEMSATFVALIQQAVVNNWSRPPSARNGMEAELQIQLIPTGEIVSVTVLRSSGNPAFDRSAVNAVEKAGSFPELQKLPGGEFERTFRRFRLLFKPEDLRY
jgi:colicin import membrane protein